MKIPYVDTNIYIDDYDDRPGRGFIHQGKEAKSFFHEIESGLYGLITSDHLDYQLRNYIQYQAFLKRVDALGFHTHLTCTEEDRKLARAESRRLGVDYEDCLHFVLAMRGHASCIITQNERHFAQFRDRIPVTRPRHIHLLI